MNALVAGASVTPAGPPEDRSGSHALLERPFVILGARGDPRVRGFDDALARAGLAPAHLIDYRDVCARPSGSFAHELPAGALLRIESPGRDPSVAKALLAAGIPRCRAAREPFIAADAVMLNEKGRILEPRQAFRGLGAVLDRVSATLLGRSDVTSLLDPALIKLAFDKRSCHAALSAAGISVPRALPPPACFDDLIEQMRAARLPRVFVKLRHGSAASGMVALATSPRGVAAWTTVQYERRLRVELFNTRAVRRIEGTAGVAALIEALIPLGVHVEAWVPKAGIGGVTCDLRVLVVAGEPAHMVLRKSRTPFTNLHLGNERAPAAELKARMSIAAWSGLIDTCRRVGRRFARSFHVALDVAVTAGLRRHYVLEVNAFGDLLRDVHIDGLDPYTFEIAQLPRWLARQPP